MTSKLQLSLFIFGTVFLFLSFSSNPPNGKTGAPGESTCNECHTGSNSALDGEISISGLPTSADANTTYPLTITLTNPNGVAVRGGFQWVAIDEDNNNAGDIDNASTGSALMISSGREYHEHNGNNFFGGAPLTWTADWTAPNLAQGTEVTFYAIGNIGNGSGSANDRIRLTNETITINASAVPLEVEIDNQTDPLCFMGDDGTATLTVIGGTPPYTFDWSNGETTNPAESLEVGMTSVEVMDDNGNTVETSVTLGEPTQLEVDEISNNSPICLNGLDGQIEVAGTGGTPPYSYTWSDGQAGPLAVNLEAGDYVVEVEDNNSCIENLTVTVTEQGLPVLIMGNTSFCEGTSTTLNATAGYTTYTWSTGDLTEEVTVENPGTYSVVVSDDDGCTGIDYITLIEIPVTPFIINGPAEICPGTPDTLSLTEQFSSYLWSDGSTAPMLSIDTCTTFIVTVTDSLGCQQVKTKIVECPTDLEIILIENTAVTCIGECDGILEAGLANSANGSGSWSTGSTANRITDLCPGTYTYTVVDATGCSNTETYTITEPLALGLTIDTIVPPICYDDTTSFIAVHATGGIEPYFYFWPENMMGDTITEFDSGIYSVTLVDSNNCVDSFDVVVPDVLPLIIVVEQTVGVICHGDSTGQIITSAIGGHGGYLYQWSNGETQQDITNLPADTYALTVTDSLGCSETKLIPVIQNTKLEYTSVVTDESETGSEDGTIDINVSGGTGTYTYLWSNGDTTSIITDLPPGTYTCEVRDNADCLISITENINAGNCLIDINTLVTNLNCFGDNDGSISVEIVNGISPFEINISDSNGASFDANALIAGDYSVLVEDSKGCIVLKEFTVTSPDELQISLHIIDVPSCTDIEDGLAEVMITGGSESYEVLWESGSIELISAIGSTSTSVTVIDTNGCMMSGSVNAGFDDKISPTVILQPLTIDISDNGGLLIPDASEFDAGSTDNCSEITFTYEYEPVVVCGTATYQVEILVTDEANNSELQSTTLTVRDVTAPIVSCPADIIVDYCEEVVYEVTATDNCGEELIITLTEGLESQAQFDVGATQVTYTATDNSNNINTCTFTVTRLPEVPITASGIDVSCFEGSDGQIELDSNGVDYISITANGASLEDLVAGDYIIEATDLYGCLYTTSVTISQPPELSLNVNSVTDEQIVDGNDGSISASLSGGTPPYQLTWYLDGELISETSTDLIDLAPGTYYAEVTDNNSCFYTSEEIIIEEKISSSINEVVSDQIKLVANPNPATSSITFTLQGNPIDPVSSIEVYTIQGQLIHQENRPNGLTLDINHYQTGIYFTRIKSGTLSYSVRWSKL